MDFVSQETLPGLLHAADDKASLEGLAWKALKGNNFLTGCNPVAIMMALQKNAQVVTASVKVGTPWRWHLGKTRIFLVAAITFVKHAEK